VTGDKTQIPGFIYAGQGGMLSVEPLRALLEAGICPQAVIVPQKPIQGTRHKRLNLLPVQPPRLLSNLANLAIEADLPLIKWERGADTDIQQRLAEHSPACVVVSCFPWRVANELLTIPDYGWWNLHPSLLPAYRGPSPLFWQARDGLRQTGITLHQMDEDFDEGDILGQVAVDTSEMTVRQLEQQLGQLGGRLIEKALSELQTGTFQLQAQNGAQASYQSMPTMSDRRLATTGKASDTFKFIKQVYESYPLWFELDGQRFSITQPIAADDEATLETAWHEQGNQLQIRFETGVLTVQVEALYGRS